MNEEHEHVRVRRQGRLGRITLDRPRSLNALTHSMILAVEAGLESLVAQGVAGVVLDGEGERGFCAGGDVKAVARSAAGDGSAARALWRDEYRLNARIAASPCPVVALLPGVVLGGGVGLGGHARTRVVTADSRVGMPEVRIGMVPDVGGTWLLSRAPGELGTHLALTAGTAGPADAIACGLADVHVPRAVLDAVAAAQDLAEVDELLARGATEPEPGELVAARAWVDECYAPDDVGEVLARLDAAGEAAADRAAAAVRTGSPTALVVTLAVLRQARGLGSLAEALAAEYRAMATGLGRADVREGIRAQVVDKTRDPRWEPADLAEVDPALVARHLAVRPDDELDLAVVGDPWAARSHPGGPPGAA